MAKIKIYNPKTIQNARSLRKNSTTQERKLWSFLKSSKFYGYKFRRQFPIENFIADLCCVRAKFVIELDGGQHNELTNREYDFKRTEVFERNGYRVLRVWNNEIDGNLDGVGEKIYQMLGNPHPLPFSQREKGGLS